MHVTFVVHESEPGRGFVTHRFAREGFRPDPTGSDPLLGERPETIIGRRLIALSARFNAPDITHEVLVHAPT